MLVREIPAKLVIPSSKVPRSVGIHVSGIIRCIGKEAGILPMEVAEELSLTDVRDITDPVAVTRICMGLAWEEWYIPQLPDVLDHPGELEVDGVYLSPDGESLSVIITPKGPRYQIIVHEVKCTYKSTRTVGDLSSQFIWMAQIKAYCNAMNTRFAMLHVLFVCGDYSYPIRPMLKIFAIEFTQDEIDSNWQMLKDYRDTFGYERRG